MEQKTFIREYVKHLLDKNAAIFAGAGLSMEGGMVSWSQLLAEIAQDLKLEIDKETDLIMVAQFHETTTGNRSALNRKIIDEFTDKAELTETHRILSRLPISTFWTTNYDKYIETALGIAGKRVQVKSEIEHLADTKSRSQAVVYKMHGDIDKPNAATLTKDDYERYHRDKEGFVTALGADLISKNFLFVGFSFTDPNIDYVLSRVRLFLKGTARQHYCILKRESFDANLAKANGKSRKQIEQEKAESEYRAHRQLLMIAELKRFNIATVLVDKHSEIQLLLAEVERQYKRKTIFISGSALHYAPHTELAALQFIHDLSREIVKDKFSVVTGFGLGIGSAVINGALEAIEQAPDQCNEEQLIMRPFPQVATGGVVLKELWLRYRTRMLSLAGVAIFVFGNKLKTNPNDPNSFVIEDATGVRAEFELAKAQGLVLLPVGATGSITRELWQEVADDYSTYFLGFPPAMKGLFMSLGNDKLSLDEHGKTLIKILSKLNQFS